MTSLRLRLLVLGLLLPCATAFAEVSASCPQPGQPAPPFGLLMGDGSPGVSLRTARKNHLPAVVNFWAWNCSDCVDELPLLQKIAREYEGKIVFLLVHPKDEEKMKAKLAQLHVSLPSATDDNKEVAHSYCVEVLPRTFFIDRDGVLLRSTAALDETSLRRELARLLVPSASPRR